MSVYLYLGVGGGAPRDIQIDDTPSVIIAGVVRVLIKRLIGEEIAMIYICLLLKVYVYVYLSVY